MFRYESQVSDAVNHKVKVQAVLVVSNVSHTSLQIWETQLSGVVHFNSR